MGLRRKWNIVNISFKKMFLTPLKIALSVSCYDKIQDDHIIDFEDFPFFVWRMENPQDQNICWFAKMPSTSFIPPGRASYFVWKTYTQYIPVHDSACLNVHACLVLTLPIVGGGQDDPQHYIFADEI